MARRFRIGVHDGYDHAYGGRKEASTLLNPTAFAINMDIFRASDEPGCRDLRYQLGGDETGHVIDSYGHRVPAPLLMLKENLYERARLAIGFTPEEVDQMLDGKLAYPRELDIDPCRLMSDFWYALAAVDVCTEEIAKLKAKIDMFERERHAATILRYGPLGHFLGGKESKFVDGQRIVDGRIDEPLSPYHEMDIDDYLTFVVEPFKTSGATKRKFGGYSEIPKHKLPPRPIGKIA